MLSPAALQFEDQLTQSLEIRRYAVIDIGSNSVRLVVYEGPVRAPLPICNEKALCGLGRGLTKGKNLNPDAVTDALATLKRFRILIEAYGNPPTKVIATAAVREAQDGKRFIKSVQELGFEVSLLSGEQEGIYAANGVLSFKPKASGLVGDMGGGSLELVSLDKGDIRHSTSLSIGPFRLMEESKNNIEHAKALVDQSLDDLDWLKPKQFSTLYAVGGAWRAIAQIHMRLRHYPLSILHHYTLTAHDAQDICRLIERQSRRSLEDIPGIPRRRLDTLPYAALVMEKLLKKFDLQTVIVSAGGAREGVLFQNLSSQQQSHDPLIALARFFAERFSSTPEYGLSVIRLTNELFPGEAKSKVRLRYMVCLMIDVAAYFHPDHRGAHAFDTALRTPIVGLTHDERLMAALALYRRHHGRRALGPNEQAVALLSWEDQQYALHLGLALRFAAAFAPKVSAPLEHCRLSLEDGVLRFLAPRDREPLLGELPLKRLQSLATAMEVQSEVVFTD